VHAWVTVRTIPSAWYVPARATSRTRLALRQQASTLVSHGRVRLEVNHCVTAAAGGQPRLAAHSGCGCASGSRRMSLEQRGSLTVTMGPAARGGPSCYSCQWNSGLKAVTVSPRSTPSRSPTSVGLSSFHPPPARAAHWQASRNLTWRRRPPAGPGGQPEGGLRVSPPYASETPFPLRLLAAHCTITHTTAFVAHNISTRKIHTPVTVAMEDDAV
jgi:hypothetical protein